MKVHIDKGFAKGSVAAPPSKSMAHRHLFCAALANGTSVVNGIGLSDDIKATISCLESLGASIELSERSATVRGIGKAVALDPVFDCNECGSTLRFMIPLSSVFSDRCRFIGSEVLLSRPLSVYEKIFSERGMTLVHGEGCVTTTGNLTGGLFEFPGDVSSQFVTGLLLALPLMDEDSRITLTGTVESRPYIDMTIQVLGRFGVNVSWDGPNSLAIPGGQVFRPCESTVEGDYSNAAFFEALNCLGGSVQVTGLNSDSLQGDRVYKEHFERLLQGHDEIDISDCPDLGPVLFAVAAANHGALFTGTRRLRIKESDRVACMCTELSKFGVRTDQGDNSVEIMGDGIQRPSEILNGHNDHRIVMALSVLLTMTGGDLEGAQAVAKSFPDFFERLGELGIAVYEVR